MIGVNISTGLRVTFSAAARILLVAGLLLSAVASGEATASVATTAAPAALPVPEQGPQQGAVTHLMIENVGQFAGEARFVLKQGNQRIWLTADALWLTAPDPLADGEVRAPAQRLPGEVAQQRHPLAAARPGTAIRLTFPGANAAPTLEPYGRLSTRVSYLIGNDPANWRQDVPVWSGVRYRNLYPDVDLVIGDGAAGTVPWRLEAQPGADLSAVTLRVEGADSVTSAADGLELEMAGKMVNLALPAWSLQGQPDFSGSTIVRQTDGGAFAIAPGAQVQAGTEPKASAAGVTAAADLIYNTPLAGAVYDVGYAIAADSQGNTYITGETQSFNLPANPGSFDPTNGGTTDATEAFVAKFNPNGSGLPVYLTYLGGEDLDIGWGIAVSGGVAFVAGETKSTTLPGMAGVVLGAGTDLFVAALNANGTGVHYMTRLGGTAYDAAYAIAVQGLEAYFVGTTTSSSVCAGSASGDLLVGKLNAAGTSVYSTCFGYPDTMEAGYAIAVRNGEAFVAGDAWLLSRDIIVGRIAASGAVAGGTEVSASGDDWSNGIAVDDAGSIYVAGTTQTSVGFPGTVSTAPWGGGETDAVVLKLHPVGTSMVLDFATYLGGEGDDFASGIAVDTVQGLYVAGTTASSVFPMTTGAYDEVLGGGFDVFVARMHLGANSTAPDKVTYATYLGAANEDWGGGVATDTGGHAYVTGSSATSANWNSTNAFVAKLKVSSPLAAPVLTITRSGTSSLLTWNAVAGRSFYQVFRSSQPYFQPGDWSSWLPVPQPTATSYTDVNALAAVNSYFYVVKTVNAAPEASVNSNRVGKFTYPLVKGN